MNHSNNESPQLITGVIQQVAKIVSGMAGIQLGEKQYSMIDSRLRSRILKLGLSGFEEYLKYLKSNEESESQALLSLMTTHHTYFFREFSHFEFLLNNVLPGAIERARKRPDKTIHIWSAACSKGQEVYSLAMFFDFHLKQMAPDVFFHIWGSDVDPESVKTAMNGVYRNDELGQSPAMYVNGYWTKGTGNVTGFSKVKPELHNKCSFTPVNLLDLNRFIQGKAFDVIFCRNVFIYFNQEQIKSITSNMMKSLDKEGSLILGVSETLNGLGLDLQLVGPSAYQFKSVVRPTPQKATLNVSLRTEPIKVLCVDDSGVILTLLKKILSSSTGFKVIGTATNGLEALDFLKKETPDIITLDLHMPELDGVGFLKKHDLKKTPVLVLSSINREDTTIAQQAIKLGAADYVEKPSLENLAQAGNEIRSKLKTILQNHETKKGGSAVSAATVLSQKATTPTRTVIPAKTTQPLKTVVAPAKPSSPSSQRIGVTSSFNGSKAVSSSRPSSSTSLSSRTNSVSSKTQPPKNLSSSRPSSSLTLSSSSLKKSPSPVVSKSHSTGQKPQSLVNKNQSISKNVGTEKNKKIKVLIVDDSATIRNLLSKILSADPIFDIVGTAERPSLVEGLIKDKKPDVITLDINMPEMDGIQLLEKIHPKYNIPTVMISSISKEEGPQVLRALEIGAVDYIQKPQMNDLAEASVMIRDRLKIAATAKLGKKIVGKKAISKNKNFSGQSVVVIGSSTGGTEAVRVILEAMPDNIPPVLITQHIPPVFSAAFAARLNELFKFEVREARDGDEVKPNLVLVAPGGKQMGVKAIGDKLTIRITDDAPVNRHKPSVDFLYKSVLDQGLTNSVGVILTGMGADGAREMKAMRDQGIRTIAQNEASCVVFGMPREAIEMGGAEFVLPLENIAEKILNLVDAQTQKKNSKAA